MSTQETKRVCKACGVPTMRVSREPDVVLRSFTMRMASLENGASLWGVAKW
jgi:hypothetical protein